LIPNNNKPRSQRAKDKGKITKNQVKQMIQSSKVAKFWDFYSAYGASTFVTGDLTSIPAGTGANVRAGLEVRARKLKLNYLVTIGDAYNVLRLIIFRWVPNDASDVPGDNEIFSTRFTSGSADPMATFFGEKPSRFKVLYDKIHTLDVAHVIQATELSLDLGFDISFNPGANTGRNHIYFATITDSAVVPNPGIQIYSTMYFDE
jgi:hypothetical protein